MTKRDRRNVLLVLGHGREISLCHHLLEVAKAAAQKAGAECRVHDLLADGFDPVLRLEPKEPHPTLDTAPRDRLLNRYHEDVRWADSIVIVHPVWWFAPPAILKGWVDRVLIDGVALTQKPNAPPEGILGDRRALVIQTFNTRQTVDRVVFGGITQLFWKRGVFLGVGITKVQVLPLYTVENIPSGKLKAAERRIEKAVLRTLK